MGILDFLFGTRPPKLLSKIVDEAFEEARRQCEPPAFQYSITFLADDSTPDLGRLYSDKLRKYSFKKDKQISGKKQQVIVAQRRIFPKRIRAGKGYC